MPHYIDGTEAKVGDIARGKPYNTPYEVVGVITGITPDADSCNLRIAFTAFADNGQDAPVVVAQIDYGETKAFELVKSSLANLGDGRPEKPYSDKPARVSDSVPPRCP
jgi:hypothetical protein